MAILTPVTLAQAQRLGEQLRLQVIGVAPVLRGVNSNFELQLAGGGRAFMRICEEAGPAEVRAQNRLTQHLAEAGVPTPRPLVTAAGETMLEHQGKPVVLFPFCPGSSCCQAAVTPAHTRQIGEVLATIHQAGQGYRTAPANRFGLAELRRRLRDLTGRPLAPEISGAVAELSAELDRLEAAYAAPADTVIHGDLFRDNVLFAPGGPPLSVSAVLDFELASLGSPAFDLAVALLAWCYGDDLHQPLCQALVAGYEAVRPLSDGELSACFDQARLAAVRFAITRIADYELRPAAAISYKDYRRFISRLAAVEDLGPGGFVRFIRA